MVSANVFRPIGPNSNCCWSGCFVVGCEFGRRACKGQGVNIEEANRTCCDDLRYSTCCQFNGTYCCQLNDSEKIAWSVQRRRCMRR